MLRVFASPLVTQMEIPPSKTKQKLSSMALCPWALLSLVVLYVEPHKYGDTGKRFPLSFTGSGSINFCLETAALAGKHNCYVNLQVALRKSSSTSTPPQWHKATKFLIHLILESDMCNDRPSLSPPPQCPVAHNGCGHLCTRDSKGTGWDGAQGRTR